jgi:predicted ribosome quality control (RQC) complex YloA/Tae2 family protein
MNDEKSIVDEILQLKFTDAFLSTTINFDKSHEDSQLHSKKYPYLGKEILSLLDKRSKNSHEISKQSLMNQILHDIKSNNPFLYKDRLSGKLNLSFFPEDTESTLELVSFEKINDALKYFISQKQKDYKLIEAEKSPAENLEKKLVHLEKKQQHLSNRVLAGCKDQEYQRIGNLLLLNLWKIKTGDKKIQLEDIYQSNQPIVIELNPKYNPKENADSYFKKAKSERKDYEESKRLLNEVKKDIDKLKQKLSEFNLTDVGQFSSDSTSSFGTKKRLAQTNQNSKNKFRHFILHEKYLIFVGKNSKNNDELTTSFAKQNDYWLHARSVSGSHVVLRWDKSLGEIQKSILEKAASIAAFYSKAKTSGLVPVSYTEKKYVIKRKGMEPGKVALLKEKVLIVKPEIPKECKIITD